jgi:hypothetical protein
MTFMQFWYHYTIIMHADGTSQGNYEESMNLVFANHSKESAV